MNEYDLNRLRDMLDTENIPKLIIDMTFAFNSHLYLNNRAIASNLV